MTLRQEIYACIDDISESKLIALKPLLVALADDSVVIEYDLTDEERAEIAEVIAEYRTSPGSFTLLDDLK